MTEHEIVSAYADRIVEKLRQHDGLFYRELKELTRPPYDWRHYPKFNAALKLACKQGRARKVKGMRLYQAIPSGAEPEPCRALVPMRHYVTARVGVGSQMVYSDPRARVMGHSHAGVYDIAQFLEA